MAGEDKTWLSQANTFIHKVLPHPLLRTAAIGGLAYGGARLAWKPLKGTFKSLVRPLAHRSGMTDDDLDAAFEEIDKDKRYKYGIPAALAGTAMLAHNVLNYNPRRDFSQVWSNNPGESSLSPYSFSKHSAFGPGFDPEDSNNMFEYDGYLPDLDYGKAITANDAKSLFSNDPYLQMPENSYARQLGTSIITNAQQQSGGSNHITLGSVFDSAVDKFNSKLSLGGVTSVGVKTVVSNGLSRLFTSALDSVVGLEPSTQNAIIDAGTWAGAITSILE